MTQKPNILEIEDDTGPLVTIGFDGTFVARQPDKMTEAADIFWNRIRLMAVDIAEGQSKSVWIVWNEDRSECVGFDEYTDAHATSTGEFSGIASSLALHFHESYGEEGPLEIQEIKVER